MKSALHLDFETYSEVDIKKVGAWAYSCHPSTEIICMGSACGGHRSEIPYLATDIIAIATTIEAIVITAEQMLTAWNSFFELSIIVNTLPRQYIKSIREKHGEGRYQFYGRSFSDAENWKKKCLDMSLWDDTAATAAALALPRTLGDCAEALGLPNDQQKDKRGKYLIQRLCKPYRGERVRDPELLEELYEYCKQDVITENAVSRKLRPLSKQERAVWELDQTINARGVPVDTRSVSDAIHLIDQTTEQLNKKVERITNGALVNVSQRARVLDYINEQGISLDAFDKVTLEKTLKRKDLPQDVRQLIEIRQQTGKTSNAKYATLNSIVSTDGRARGLLLYHGASTGRWSGRLFQPQNIPRGTVNNPDACISLFHQRDPELIEMLCGDAMDVLSSCLRGMICASPGHVLFISDYSAIEARVLAWLTHQKDVLEVFRTHEKLYEHTASKIYKKPVEGITGDERFVGKVASLALGYGGGVAAFVSMAEVYGVNIDEAFAEKIKTDWRRSNRNIVNYWYDCERAAIDAVKSPGSTHKVNNIRFGVRGDFLFIVLPSGRPLAYYKPDIGTGRFDNECVTFMGTNSVTRKWERQQTYGGKLVENITQAVARDLMANAMGVVENSGYHVVLSVHDELIAEVPERFGNIEEFNRLMCNTPNWAKGLPISAKGFTSKRYKK